MVTKWLENSFICGLRDHRLVCRHPDRLGLIREVFRGGCSQDEEMPGSDTNEHLVLEKREIKWPPELRWRHAPGGFGGGGSAMQKEGSASRCGSSFD